MDRNLSKEYYSKIYAKVQRRGIQGLGNSLIDMQIERFRESKSSERLLEIGGSSGEHYRFIKKSKLPLEYVVLDLYPRATNPELAKELEKSGKVKFVQGDASRIPFNDEYFDTVISTCVLAHVLHPEKVLEELLRVTAPQGQIIISMPCDPGVFNRFIKFIYNYRSMKKNGIENPKLLYAREHINSVDKLITLISHVFGNYKIKFNWFPLKINSWNSNLIVTATVTKLSTTPD